ncbi:CpaD family pilus assembly protein [Tianweitania sediminis]|uniref:CpaD family pilus assembly protein n=1 Tax=Tianweitania sediminis TaxID=1502156 RepID=A0A8J7R4H0_9HYPH|nr:CpaD family pilus assembly lipoprotein [Tianweitania sediminis]MBP0440566.1 CpaD family pilus assembly protein [Tianweitania sediminis]
MQNKISRMPGKLLAAVALATIAFAAGCSTNKPDSVIVGSVPDDYRTNHPIMIGEKERKIDLPVGMADRGMTPTQKIALEGFLADYDTAAQPPVTIIVPVGSANELAASNAAHELMTVMTRNGVPPHRIATAAYRARPGETAAPIRVSTMAMKAYTKPCGRWPEDIGDTTDNKHWANFGCSYQNNLAAQIANPADLLGPRKQGPIDAENRGVAIGDYKAKDIGFEPTIDYDAN